MRSVLIRRAVLSRLALLCLSFLGTAQAGAGGSVTVPVTSIFGFPFQSNLTSAGLNQQGLTQALTITNLNLSLAAIQTIAIAGANQADFQIVSGGTCQPGTTVLTTSSPGNSCTVNVAYRPSTGGLEVAQLNVGCVSQVSAGAGYIVTCAGVVGKIGDLVGSIASLVAAPTPTLGPAALTGLALLMFGVGLYAAIKRERRGR